MKKNFTIFTFLVLGVVFGISNVFAYDASRGNAYSFATDYNSGRPFDLSINTSDDAIFSANSFYRMGFNSYYNIQPTYQALRGVDKNSGKNIMESKMLFFSGHGNWTRVSFNYKGKGGDYKTGVFFGPSGDTDEGYKLAGIYSYDMSKVKMIVFGACYTAHIDDNIAKRAVDRGARVSLGWSDAVDAEAHGVWFENFLTKLEQGRTIRGAINYANGFTYDDSRVKSVVVYGDDQYTPAWDTGVATTALQRLKKMEYQVSDQRIKNVDLQLTDDYTIDELKNTVENYIINNIDSNFNINDYQYELTEGQYANYYDFSLMVNGYVSDSSYTVVVENNKIVSVVDNTKDINVNKVTLKNVSKSDNEVETFVAKEEAVKMAMSKNSNYEIVSQKVRKIYQVEDNSYKTKVFTEVYDKESGTYYVYNYTK